MPPRLTRYWIKVKAAVVEFLIALAGPKMISVERVFVRLERIMIPAFLLAIALILAYSGGGKASLEAAGRLESEKIKVNQVLFQQSETNSQMREALKHIAEAMKLIHEGNVRSREESRETQKLLLELLAELKKGDT